MSESFSAFNRLTNALELFKILVDDDGVAFDEHFKDILKQECTRDFGAHAQILTPFSYCSKFTSQSLQG